jgi:hypothetical protein
MSIFFNFALGRLIFLNWNDAIVTCIVTGRWFSPGAPVSSTNKTDRHDITEILLTP